MKSDLAMTILQFNATIYFMKKYIPNQIEPKWQKRWEEDKLFSPDMDKAEKPYYSLMMFPYPSAEGLHVGNVYAFTGSDIYSRFKRMSGFDVFEPIGLDGFGIHSENYALKIGEHPMDLSKKTEKRFYDQLHIIGNSFDWKRTVETYKPNYYKWTQWLFLQMYKKGLAYRKKAMVNWCPSCLTVLADEQVISGECERCASKVEQKLLEQWFFRITDYAEKLLGNLEKLDWSEKVKIAQEQWIGKRVGTFIRFKIKDPRFKNEEIEVFTTRGDTLYGATFLVLAPEHPIASKLLNPQVKKYAEEAKKKVQQERMAEEKDKTGVFTGLYAINPLNQEEIPVWVADYAVMGFGTGALFGDAHDERDVIFAKKYGISLKATLITGDKERDERIVSLKECFTGDGILVESGEFTGLTSKEAREKVAQWLAEKGKGGRKVTYHLRDWLISRQRYWGPPIPIIYCDNCGTVPVPEKDLPVELPYVEDFRPTGKGVSPLASDEKFYEVKCPNCGGQAKRETDVSDTFLDSAWYFLRYPSTEFDNVPFAEPRTKKWLPVNMYIGGAEHSVLHLLYSRFITMVLKDLGYLNFEEPFSVFRAHGLVIKNGAKMSKSKGNIVNPDDYIKEYGADTLRTYLMFVGPYSEGGDFNDNAIHGIYKFLQRVWGLQEKLKVKSTKLKVEDLRIMHKTIKKVTEDLSELKYNTAIASLMEWLNYLSAKGKVEKEEYKTYLLLLAPFAPHITEELWSSEAGLGEKYSIHEQSSSTSKHSWPQFDNKYLEEEEISIAIQINGKVRDSLMIQKDIINNREVIEKMAKESAKVSKFLHGQSVKKVIYVPGKIISFVI